MEMPYSNAPSSRFQVFVAARSHAGGSNGEGRVWQFFPAEHKRPVARGFTTRHGPAPHGRCGDSGEEIYPPGRTRHAGATRTRTSQSHAATEATYMPNRTSETPIGWNSRPTKDSSSPGSSCMRTLMIQRCSRRVMTKSV